MSKSCIGDDTKAATRRNPNFRKTKNNSVESGYTCSNAEIMQKTCLPTQNFTEIGQSGAEFIWPQRFSVWRPFAILKSKIIHILSRDCHRIPDLLSCTKFHQNLMIFRWYYGDLVICNMAAVGHVGFSKFRVYACDFYRHAILLPCAKFHWNQTIGCWVMAKKWLLKWPRFQGHGVTINALDVLCAQLTRDLFAIAKFLVQSAFKIPCLTYYLLRVHTYCAARQTDGRTDRQTGCV